MFNRAVSILLMLVIVSLTGCGTIVTPVPLAALNHDRQIASATTAPSLSATLPPATPNYLIRIDANSVQVGRWLWRTFTTSAAAYPPVQLWLDVAEGGTINGVLSIYPNSPEIPQSALTLIQQNGCNVSFESLDDSPIQGAFVSTTEAYVQIDITTCAVKYYGEVTLTEPLRGDFFLEYDDAVTQALLHPVDVPLTPLERGRKIFTQYCSACHGTYGEGAPGIPSLNTDQVRGYTDDQILQIITNGVINTVMPAWGAVLSPEDIEGVLTLVRNIEILDSAS